MTPESTHRRILKPLLDSHIKHVGDISTLSTCPPRGLLYRLEHSWGDSDVVEGQVPGYRSRPTSPPDAHRGCSPFIDNPSLVVEPTGLLTPVAGVAARPEDRLRPYCVRLLMIMWASDPDFSLDVYPYRPWLRVDLSLCVSVLSARVCNDPILRGTLRGDLRGGWW